MSGDTNNTTQDEDAHDSVIYVSEWNKHPIPSGLKNRSPADKLNTMDDNLTRSEIDAKIAASEARTDSKFARIEGKFDLVFEKLDRIHNDFNLLREDNASLRNDNKSLKYQIWGVGVGLAALIVAVISLLPPFFGAGVQIKDIVDAAIEKKLSHENQDKH
jgi:hypothetical protein